MKDLFMLNGLVGQEPDDMDLAKETPANDAALFAQEATHALVVVGMSWPTTRLLDEDTCSRTTTRLEPYPRFEIISQLKQLPFRKIFVEFDQWLGEKRFDARSQDYFDVVRVAKFRSELEDRFLIARVHTADGRGAHNGMSHRFLRYYTGTNLITHPLPGFG